MTVFGNGIHYQMPSLTLSIRWKTWKNRFQPKTCRDSVLFRLQHLLKNVTIWLHILFRVLMLLKVLSSRPLTAIRPTKFWIRESSKLHFIFYGFRRAVRDKRAVQKKKKILNRRMLVICSIWKMWNRTRTDEVSGNMAQASALKEHARGFLQAWIKFKSL